MKKLLCALVFVYLVASQVAASEDFGGKLMSDKGNMVISLTPPGNPNTGGTGFAVAAPSGREYVLTNRHVCGLAVNGEMEAHYNQSERTTIIKVLEESEDTDLCLLEQLPNMGVLHLADSIYARQELFVIGHPLLKPLTFSSGYIVDREIIRVMEDKEPENCVRRNEHMEEVPSWLGPVRECIARVDAYDSSIVIYPGNSGSPVFNRDEEVVGVVFAGDNRTNYGSFIPLDVVQAFLAIY